MARYLKEKGKSFHLRTEPFGARRGSGLIMNAFRIGSQMHPIAGVRSSPPAGYLQHRYHDGSSV